MRAVWEAAASSPRASERPVSRTDSEVTVVVGGLKFFYFVLYRSRDLDVLYLSDPVVYRSDIKGARTTSPLPNVTKGVILHRRTPKI